VFFKRKGHIRRQEEMKLYSLMNHFKERWEQQKILVSKSVDPPESVLYELKLLEAKYLFLFREARSRHFKKSGG